MGEILSRLDEKLFRVVFFGDKMIQNEPVEDWPVCDVLIAFYSAGEDTACTRIAALIGEWTSNDIVLAYST